MITINGGSNYKNKKIILIALALGSLADGVGFSNNQSTMTVQNKRGT